MGWEGLLDAVFIRNISFKKNLFWSLYWYAHIGKNKEFV